MTKARSIRKDSAAMAEALRACGLRLGPPTEADMPPAVRPRKRPIPGQLDLDGNAYEPPARRKRRARRV